MTSVRKVDRMGFAADDLTSLSDTDLGTTLDFVQSTGVQWLRVWFMWSSIQTSTPTGTDKTDPTNAANNFNFSAVDRVITAAMNRGLTVFATVHGVPAWANGNVGDYQVPPTTGQDFANFVAGCVRHVNASAQNVKGWELWYRPNLGANWHSAANTQGPQPIKYADMVNKTWTTVKAADATAQLLLGAGYIAASNAVNYEMVDWWTQLYANAIAGKFDAWSVQFNQTNMAPTQASTANMFLRLGLVRNLQGINGDWGKLVWASEVSVPTYTDTVTPANTTTEAQQATLLTQWFTSWDQLGQTGPMLWHGIRDAVANDPNNASSNMGVLHFDYSQKAAVTALLAYANRGPTVTARNYSDTAPQTALSAGITNNATSLPVGSTSGFPAPPFILVLERNNISNREIVLCTAIVDATHFTVTRGYDGTPQLAHGSGATVEHTSAAIDFADANYHITDPNHDHHTQYVRRDMLQAPGDIYAGTGPGGVQRVPVGAPGTVLTVDTTVRGANLVFKTAVPSGTIIPFAGNTAPTGWLTCDGSPVSRTTYATLFAALGTNYGVGDGTTTFNLPDLRGRVPIGVGTGAGLTTRALGASGGEEAHVQTVAEMPSHTHVQNPHTHIQNAHNHAPGTPGQFITNPYPGVAGWLAGANASGNVQENGGTTTANTTAVNQSTTATNQNAGGGAAANVMQPYLVLLYVVKT